MRRGSSTVVSVVGAVREETLRRLARSPNVALLHPEGEGLDAAVDALSRAGGMAAPFVVVGADPLAEAAAEWSRMWDLARGPGEFEVRAGLAIAAWRAERFELPDYYLVLTSERADATGAHPHDFYLGVLRTQRPSRVVAVPIGADADEASALLDALTSLPQGPWWPSLEGLIASARSFFPGALTG